MWVFLRLIVVPIFYIFFSFFLIQPAYAGVTVVSSKPENTTSTAIENCSPKFGYTCNNGPSQGNSGGCGLGCDFGNSWEKWTFSQNNNCYKDLIFIDNYYAEAVISGDVCSTADKYNDRYGGGNLTMLRAGDCSCSTGSLYKTCCNGTTPVDAYNYTSSTGQGNPSYPDGACPGGSTRVDCGGAGQPACGAAACAPLGPTCLQDECTVEGAQWCDGSSTSKTCVRKSQPNPACSPNTYLAVNSTTCTPAQTCSNGQCVVKTCTVDILANPQGISRGEETRLAWFSSNAASCSIPGIGTVPVSGEKTVSPNQTTTYSITCSPAAGTSCSDNVRVTVSSGTGGGVTCPGGECTAGQANTKQCAGTNSKQTCQLDPIRGRYCWTTEPCPTGQTCTGSGTCEGQCSPSQTSCGGTCWSCLSPYQVSCQSGVASCVTPPPTTTTPPSCGNGVCNPGETCPADCPAPTPPPSCGPVVLGPDCLNPCTGQKTCNYSNRFLYFACTGDSVCLSQELDDTCIGQTNNCAPTSISGSVFLDTNQDGTKQATEALYGGGTNVTVEYTRGPYAPGYCSGWAGSYNSCMKDYMQICDEFGGQERTRCIAEAEGYCGPCKYPPRPTGAPSTPPPPTVTSIGPGQYKVTSPTAGEDLPTGTYTVTYQPPGTYQTTEPPSGNSFTVIVGPGCSPGASKNASCFGGSVNNLHFGLLASNPWFQSTGADLRIDSGFSADIPANATCGAYASLPGTGGSPGVIYSGTRGSSFGGGQASQTNWTAGGATYPESYTPTRPNLIRTSYNYLLSVAKQAAITPINILSYCGPGGLNSCTLPASLPNGLYIANGNLTLAGGTYTFPVNKNFVILVGGNLNIRQRILVPNGSTATFSSAGDITVERSVGQAVNSSTAPDVEGFYSADKNFIADGVNNCGAGADLRLNIAGAVVVNAALAGGAFQNNRDLCEGNAQCPAFAVKERPDFVLNAPEFIKHPSFIWQESAP